MSVLLCRTTVKHNGFQNVLFKCVQKKDASSDDVTATDDPRENVEGASWTCVPDLCHHATVWEGKKTAMMNGESSFLGGPTAQAARSQSVLFALELTQGHWLSVWHFIHTISWDTDLIWSVLYSICCCSKGPENWNFNFPLWGKKKDSL